MADTKFLMWNSSGIRAGTDTTPAESAFFDQQNPNADYTFAAFVETHHRDEKDLPLYFTIRKPNFHILHSPTPPTHTHSGIILLISKEYEVIKQSIVIQGRLVNVHISHKVTKHTYNISVYYGTHLEHLTKPEMEELVNKFLGQHKVQDNNVILGDFNFADYYLDKGKGQNGKDKTFTTIWNNFKNNCNITDPYRKQFPSRKIYSFLGPQGKSRGDRVYVNEENVNSVTEYKYITHNFNTAHKIMKFTVKDQKKAGPGYWKMNSSVLNDDSYVKMIEETVLRMEQKLGTISAIDWWDLFILMVRNKTIYYCTRKRNIEKEVKNSLLKELTKLEEIAEHDLTLKQKRNYKHLKGRLKDTQLREIRGHQIRTRGLPKFEIKEPDIEFYAKLEKRSCQKNIIGELQDENGNIHSENEKLITIATQYYTKLYTPSPVDYIKQTNILKNVNKKLTAQQAQNLDSALSDEGLLKAVFQLSDDKSPGYDGITAEFYKKFWYLIKDRYRNYINLAKQTAFGEYRNTSITTIIYKDKGEIYTLSSYRPISLINIDIKILTKTLANRLAPLLPDIIHYTQTAVYRRKIDHTVHMLRDLIDLANTENIESAFIFLDQEKAFDRVNHEFLFKTMAAFGIGPGYIEWVRKIYSTASTKIQINGFLSAQIPLKRGVRGSTKRLVICTCHRNSSASTKTKPKHSRIYSWRRENCQPALCR